MILILLKKKFFNLAGEFREPFRTLSNRSFWCQSENMNVKVFVCMFTVLPCSSVFPMRPLWQKTSIRIVLHNCSLNTNDSLFLRFHEAAPGASEITLSFFVQSSFRPLVVDKIGMDAAC